MLSWVFDIIFPYVFLIPGLSPLCVFVIIHFVVQLRNKTPRGGSNFDPFLQIKCFKHWHV